MFGTDLVGEAHVPQNARAGVLIVHGMAEHRGRYADAIRRFNAAGLACFTFDLRGHGGSPGDRADITTFQVFVADLSIVRASIAQDYPKLPLFLWAHSLGSIVAIRSVEQHEAGLKGVITSGCPLAAFPEMPSPLRRTVIALCSPFRALKVNPGLPAEDLTHSAEVQASYEGDPLIPHKVTVRLLIELESACRLALTRASKVTLPWLALHGEADNIAPPQGSKQLIDALGSTDKTLELFAGMRHEVHNEVEPAATAFYDRVINWIAARTP